MDSDRGCEPRCRERRRPRSEFGRGAAKQLPLSARLIEAADFPGYVPEPSPKDYRSARTWTSLDTS